MSVREQGDGSWSFLSSNEYLGPAVVGKGGSSFSFQPYIERRGAGSAWTCTVKHGMPGEKGVESVMGTIN